MLTNVTPPMNQILGLAACSLFLALCFLVPAYLYIWTLDDRVILDEHDPAYPAPRGPVIFLVPEAEQVDLNDPLAIIEPGPTECDLLIAAARERIKNKATIPLSPSTVKARDKPLRAYEDRKEAEQNHDLQIIKSH